MKKKLTSSLLAVSFAFSLNILPSIAVSDPNLTKVALADLSALVDLSTAHWAYDSVKFVTQEFEIMDPLTPTRFAGSELATRYTVATAFYRAIKKLEGITNRDLRLVKTKSDSGMSDVSEEMKSVVSSVVNEYGIMQAMPGNKFLGEEKISRYELSFEINNYLRLLEREFGDITIPSTNRFSALSDIREDHWATTAVKNVVDEWQLMKGYPDNTFRGSQNLNRYELAAVLNGFMKLIDKYLIPLAKSTPIPTPVPTAKPTPLPTPVPTPIPTPVPTAKPTKVPLSTFDIRLGGSVEVAKVENKNENELMYGPFADFDVWFNSRIGLGIDGEYIIYGPKLQTSVPGLSRARVGGGLNWRIFGDSAEDFQAKLGLGWEYFNFMGTGYQYADHGPRGELALELPLASWIGLFAEDRFTYFPFNKNGFTNNVDWKNELFAGLNIPAWSSVSFQLGYFDLRYVLNNNPNSVIGDVGGRANIRLRF